MTDSVPVPTCKITTPHAHSSFDDPLVCPVRDAAEGRTVKVLTRSFACPTCGNPAYLCTTSDHGAVDGPALHCRAFPYHNEFDPSDFGRWTTAPGRALPHDEHSVAPTRHEV